MMIIFLPKCAWLSWLAQYRGITLLDVLSKWYVFGLIHLTELCPRPFAWRHVLRYSFESEKSVEHIINPMHILLEPNGRIRKLAFSIFAGDVANAFDNLTVDMAISAMIAAGLRPCLVTAIAQDNVLLTCAPVFEGIECDEIVISKSGKQGGD